MTRHADETLAFAKAHCSHHVEIGAYDADGCHLLIGECCTVDAPEIGAFSLKMEGGGMELQFHTLDAALCAAEAIEDGIAEAKRIAFNSAREKAQANSIAHALAGVI